MFVTSREMHVVPGRMEDAIAFARLVVDKLNADHKGALRASVEIGGDPSILAVSGEWETLGAYGEWRVAAMADPEIRALMRLSTGLFSTERDTIVRVLKRAGPRDNLAVVNSASMYMPRVGEALAFALEVADFIDVSTGKTSGVATSVTGARSRLSWFGYGKSLDEVAANADAIEGSEEYLALYKRSEDLFVPGSLRQHIWQFVA